MMPFQQGGLDSLCGIYSLINADKLINHTSEDHSQFLYNEIVSFLNKQNLLVPILTGGMNFKHIKLVLSDVEVINDRFPNINAPFSGKKTPSLGFFWKEISNFLNEASGRAVILGLSGVNDHWTTISEISEKQIRFHDSDGLKLIKRSRCTTANASVNRKHVLWPAQTLFLSK